MDYTSVSSPRDLLAWMTKNIEYGFVANDGKVFKEGDSDFQKDFYKKAIVQSAEGILETGVGTCFDQVEFERKWFEDQGFDVKTIFMRFSPDTVGSNLPTHTFLIYKKIGIWYWFENAFESERGMRAFNAYKQVLEHVSNCHMSYVIQSGKLPETAAAVLECYEYLAPEPNLSIPKYFEHVIGEEPNFQKVFNN